MESSSSLGYKNDMLSFDGFRNAVIEDYRIAMISREVSLLGRREVLTGKAKFGIFGDGKEIAQIAMAKFFQPGDFRSGYYRDQTFMFATGLASVEQYFAQLYADPDIKNEPFSAGRQMNAHFSTRFVDENGNWLDLANRKNVSSDIAPTAGQMPRGLGLAFASRCFRSTKNPEAFEQLSHHGNEICFTTIGDASTSEGHFWETINAAGVLQVPLAVFVWDDGYGISVPKNFQTTKGSISAALKGFQKQADTNGIHIYKVKAWDYAGMCEVFEEALQKVRETHQPALFHVEEVTQPQGHSTSGSHERYKSPERLEWEKEWDCIKKMKEWMIENGLASIEELTEVEAAAKETVKEARNRAWEKYVAPIKQQAEQAATLIRQVMVNDIDKYNAIQQMANELAANKEPLRRDILRAIAVAIETAPFSPSAEELKALRAQLLEENTSLYNSHLYNEGAKSALNVPEVKPLVAFDAPTVNGYEVLNKYFDALFAANPKVYAFGEDVGYTGDVNQGFAGLQEKHGKDRILDTGIRELTIVGQAIGMALRGLRPIAEIQYLDYLLYGLQPLSDDVSTTHFRTKGQQSCPVIIRTRGHRLEGIWHSGSPMGVVINALRGMYVCVPRNMVQAVGMYNTMLQSNDPAIIVECLNGYRLKEKLPDNLLEYTVPLGVPEIIREGTDVTLVSYGSTLRIIQDATDRLAAEGIDCEIVDVQTLLPFDLNHVILQSLKKTSRIIFIDEDVPGGAAAYMFNKVMEEQGGYKWLDASPRTLTAKAHRPGYGSDGDYFAKPNAEDVMDAVRSLMAE
ncbi:MAG: transketolase [Sediminibacterium sp. Gen4]|jgi:pyruvate/2-oxoglutarate/acetoin dehydrogenase E1 component/TPP-dependent pyruvate/acetoin dehydrogenase alpha subunit|uniref:alpha-ketoacid dehydrogenase subunit alpha/beta n=1 Tax=unclassified Sediminibacterium TaxID=2635961 RepID=UPI0015BD2786|nr:MULTISPECIES: thiamine pyrophosphate-dependent enzyme [unclassified Sediminibacterium]MBW0160456.1 transketolase [Sediminibacterium sp.]MBW0165435.1 transketolase [Sediminibacterium sp.]NWK65378.1 transketolase [Sediminibacterium sp. Gen4]